MAMDAVSPVQLMALSEPEGAPGDAKGDGKGVLNAIDPTCKAWVGGIAPTVTWKELEAHFGRVAKPKWAEVFSKTRTGCVAFETPAEAEVAIQSLSGTVLGNQTINVDRWGRGKGGGKGPVWRPTWVQKGGDGGFGKGYGGFGGGGGGGGGKGRNYGGFGKGKGKGKRLGQIDAALKVWVGNIAPEVTWKDMQAHFDQVAKTKWAEVFPKTLTGCVSYASAEEVVQAIAALNGTELGGQAIICDAWTKKSDEPSVAPMPEPP